jgi:hypothetical protein
MLKVLLTFVKVQMGCKDAHWYTDEVSDTTMLNRITNAG